MANINSISTLNDTINGIIAEIDYSTELFSNKMKSNTANKVFSQFEATIDKLYEKTRLLNDLRRYTENYILSEYQKKYNSLMKMLKTIEESNSEYQNKSIIAHNIEFENSIIKYTDRDGNDADKAAIINKKIICSGHEQAKYSPKISQIISDTSSNSLYHKNTNNDTGTYFVQYITDSIDGTSKPETIKYLFDDNKKINFIDIEAFNANINLLDIIPAENAKSIDNNDIYNNMFIMPCTIKGIQLNISPSDFVPRTIKDE